MPMEAETLPMISWVFYIIAGVSLFLIIKLWVGSKDKSFRWFIAQLVFLYFSFLKFTYSLKMKPEVPAAMLSEENSLALGVAGILWAISMLCMLKGIWNLRKKSSFRGSRFSKKS